MNRPALEVWLLGRFAVAVRGRAVPGDGWRSRRSGDLLKILALAPGHRLARDQIVELLWPGRDPAAAANSLHQALFALRRVLDTAGGSGAALVTFRDDVVGLGSEMGGSDVWTDVAAFEERARRARASRDLAGLRAAAEAAAGGLLPDDPYEEWAQRPRQQLAAERLRLLAALAEELVTASQWEGAEPVIEELLAADAAHEPAHRLLMRVLAATGRRQQAIRQFEALRAALADELGVDPDGASMALHAELLRDPGFSVPHTWASAPPPEALTSFVGRDREMAEVLRLLTSSRLLVLTGAGGSGKTRLAIEAARRSTERFAPLAFVPLGALAEDRAVEAAAAVALGIRERPGAALRDDVAAAIGASEGLMVLDNCEHLIGAAAALAHHLLASCPRLRILATSREPLRVPGEVVWVVPSLRLPDPTQRHEASSARAFGAVRLFEERAKAAAPAFGLNAGNVDATVRLCHRLDGLPLAIELAAARVRALSPGEMLGRLESGFDVLSAGSRTALNRQQTLRATLDWSAALLSDAERALFRRLGVFAGTFDLEACEAVCAGGGLGRESVVALLGDLVDKSLVVAEPGEDGTGYRLLVTIRDYARDALTSSGETEALRAAHADWCHRIATGADGPGPPTRWRDDIRTGVAWLLKASPGKALELAAAVAEPWTLEGHIAEIHGWLVSGLQSAPARSPARAAALLELCNVTARYGSLADCIALAEESFSIATEHDDAPAALRAAHLKGAFHWVGESPGAARAWFERSLELSERLEDTAARAAVLNSLAALAWRRGRLEAAATILEDALGLAAAAPATGGRVLLLNGSANWTLRAFDGWGWPGMTETAVPLLGTPPRALAAMLAANAGSLRWSSGDLDDAWDRLCRARAQLHALGEERGTALVEGRMALVASGRGDWAGARSLVERALATAGRLGDARAGVMLLSLLAEVEQAAGNGEAAHRHALESASRARQRQDRPALMCGLFRLGHVDAAAGRLAAARGHLREALGLADEIGGAGGGALRGWLLARLGWLAAGLGDRDEAGLRLGQAIALFEAEGWEEGAAFCHEVMASGAPERV